MHVAELLLPLLGRLVFVGRAVVGARRANGVGFGVGIRVVGVAVVGTFGVGIDVVGTDVGTGVGIRVGVAVVGTFGVGTEVGTAVGVRVGVAVVGTFGVGIEVGTAVGVRVGVAVVGMGVGNGVVGTPGIVGRGVGIDVGELVGLRVVGNEVGCEVGVPCNLRPINLVTEMLLSASIKSCSTRGVISCLSGKRSPEGDIFTNQENYYNNNKNGEPGVSLHS